MASVEASTELDHILHSSNLDIDILVTLCFSIITPLDIFALRKIAVLKDLKGKGDKKVVFLSAPDPLTSLWRADHPRLAMLAWRRVSTLTCLHRSCGQLDPTTVFWSEILRRPFWFMFFWFSRWNFVFWPYPQSAMTMKNCNERCYVAAESLYGSVFLFAFAFVVEMVRRKGDMKWGWRQQLGMRQHGSTSESVMIEWITSSQDFWSNSRWSDDFVLVRNVFLFSVKCRFGVSGWPSPRRGQPLLRSLATGAGRGKLGAIPESENEDVFSASLPKKVYHYIWYLVHVCILLYTYKDMIHIYICVIYIESYIYYIYTYKHILKHQSSFQSSLGSMDHQLANEEYQAEGLPKNTMDDELIIHSNTRFCWGVEFAWSQDDGTIRPHLVGFSISRAQVVTGMRHR